MKSLQRKAVFLVLVVCACLMLTVPQVSGAETHGLKAGVAKLDITPKDLTGLVGIPNRPIVGVHEPIFARALVLDNGVTIAAFVTLDLVEMGDTTLLRQRIQKEVGIPADHLILNASHGHSAPRGGPVTPGTSSAQGRPYSTPAYVQQVDDTVVEALKQAKAALQPARMGSGTGKVDVSVARYGYTPEKGWRENTNEEGYSDKTVWVIKFETPTGEPIAIMFNYAVHSNVSVSTTIDGDLAGMAENFVEHQYNGKVVALWSMSAAADAYPKFNGNMGKQNDQSSPYYAIELQGGMLGGEVYKVAKRITEMTGEANLWASERDVPCEMNVKPAGQAAPGAGPNGAPGAGPNGAPGAGPGSGQPQQPAKQLLPAPQPGDKLDIHLSLIRLNELAITGVSGEVGSQILVHLRNVSPFANTLMITLSNDRAGYIPEDAGWDHMGSGAAFVRGCAEKAIVDNLVQMMKATL